ncbi:tryptophan halogenase family protein [Sphingomonas sp. 8AM]|uniref:tryptophan halogenase family protein n=1 Tax=Sphingomonas sp. 8AM TaxID=2653170 RepID=UPI0012F0EBFB|nr:tryptophan halogenase family protein [Sphingomonas sp. 8AM]VXC99138.1 Tryptophan halogenase [Sphingomonas sp. 8AM]
MQRIVILGGGTAGWMAAACVARVLGAPGRTITLVESPTIGTVGVGEATIPMIESFHRMLGLSAVDVLRATAATFKLGIEFVDWTRRGERYFHPFGTIGADLNGIGFVQHWLRHRAGGGTSALLDYSAEAQAAAAGRFGMVQLTSPDAATPLHFAYHFDATLYAMMLRRYAERLGAVRIEGEVASVRRDAESGDVAALLLADGRTVEGDFFLDCSGFAGVLIEGELAAGYDDWSRWLPCNRALAVASPPMSPCPPFTRATALEAGWRWRIPLRHRTGNGHVFCDAFVSEDEAATRLCGAIGDPRATPRPLRFTTGRRRRAWVRNVVALGLASGFVEPLESTSIFMIQSALAKLMTLFPRDGRVSARVVDQYNAMIATEWERVRDFIVAHYKVTARDDTPFWRHCRSMAVPDSLSERLALFEEEGVFVEQPHDLFKEANWVAVLAGQGLIPRRHHPVAAIAPLPVLNAQLARMRAAVAAHVAALPDHDTYLARCVA